MKTTLLHNASCSKSKRALDYLYEKGIQFEIRNYLENPLSESEIKFLLEMLDCGVNELIRKNERLWAERFAEKQYSAEGLISILANYPQLMQRPILIHNYKAVIARPVERIDTIL